MGRSHCLAHRSAESSTKAQIKLANTTTDIGYAYGYFPGKSAMAGSVWFNPKYNSGTGTSPVPAAVNGAIRPIFTSSAMRSACAIPAITMAAPRRTQKTRATCKTPYKYTVMSYFDASNTGADWVAKRRQHYYAQTPMMH